METILARQIQAERGTAVEEHPLKDEVVDHGFTWRELHAAFSLVANPKDWKGPIWRIFDGVALGPEADVPDVRTLDAIEAAVPFFTGSKAVILDEGDYMSVEAKGYYAAVGA